MNSNQNNKHKFFKGSRGRFFYKNRGRGNGPVERKTRNLKDDDDEGSKRSEDTQGKTKSLKYHGDSSFPGWNLYFPGQEYKDDSLTAIKIHLIESFLKKNPKLYNTTDVEESCCFTIDINHLYDDENLKCAWKNLQTDLRDDPSHTISCMGLAMYKIVLTKLKQEIQEDEEEMMSENEISLPVIHARILNFGPIVLLKNLKSSYFGKLITVKGTIIRVGNVKLMCTWMAFQCDGCEAVQCLKQSDGIHSVPKSCSENGCRSKSFTPLVSSPLTKTLNWQCVRLQEIVSDEHREGGRVPRSIDCELTCDLVDSCSPGDVAILTGIIKVRDSEDGIRQKNANIFLQYMDVVSVTNCKNAPGGKTSEIEFNVKNYYAIKEIHSEKNLFRLIVQSLCPSIFGHEVVKAGLVLAMFGGCQRYEECRADPHVLVVGDPGLGKSRMLQACAAVSPRGVYVCGNTSTVSGLTVTLAREGGGDHVLEAGALVLSDQGCCCIDEFDKMTSQHQALLEAMEQQTVSIAKSGVVCTLPCRASILAAANPVGGHYDRSKTVSENLKLGPSLLSRFDLVFILMDHPSVQTDSLLSDHVMAMHSGLKESQRSSSSLSSQLGESAPSSGAPSLLDRLKTQPGEELDFIPHQLLRKYIAYAKKYVQPKLTEEASEMLMEFYMELRRCHQDSDSTPVTPRQLESLIRFTEARAKLELRVEATAADAADVIEILRHSLLDMFTDDAGTLDFQRSQNGSGTSTKNQARKFISVLQRRSEIQCKSVFSVQELKEVARLASVNVGCFSSFLLTLNIQGFLLKKGSQLYQLLSVD